MNYKMPHYLSITGCDVRSFTDKLRVKHPIVKNIAGEWVLLAHHNVMAAALDNERFSSNVSRYLQVPNGLDGEEHSQYRKIIERFLTRLAITPFIPVFEDVANKLVAELPKGQILDAVNDIGAVFAVRAQCAWLGWPTELEPLLLAWMKENHAATRSGNHEWTVSIAEKFDDIVSTIIQSRRANHSNSPDDITGQLCRETINGRLLTEKELVSILRNWTGGDLGSIALCVGVIVAYIAENPSLITTIQQVSDLEVEAIINEILRIDNPFVSNRRVTTCPVHVSGQDIPAGARIKLNWTSANRDETVFNNNRFDPIAHADNNLLYGIGKHVCPGRLLASWQLRIALQTLLASVEKISLVQEQLPEREIAPVGGYHRVPVIFT
ncbi:cytochrome P450 [Colwellia sp. M166]|uniref:cytochrome P450 n=1 Tax=Colwellia sp. M166 TaxID=2583805 RepID=UPI00211E0AC2|nr:cytochrome P450 [Colwellia sp. M166]UUO23520.1 cytochrome P450 [Colwellia sp. M166]|tara:strand:- start:138 stop:1280 length:1143 start_codon:yes stop_codon:yes gene_type:complete